MTREVSDLQDLQHYLNYLQFYLFYFFANLLERRRVFSRHEDDVKGVSTVCLK